MDRLERQVVPQYFCGKSPNHTPESYMRFRNAIVSKFMDNPERTLTISDCQGLVDGVDAEDLARVFRFLDHWGIINYCATSQCHPGPSKGASDVREDANGEVHVPSAALTSIDSLIRFDKPICRHKADEVSSSLPSSDVDLPDLDIRIREHLCDNHCNHCSRPLPTVYFQSQKKVFILLPLLTVLCISLSDVIDSQTLSLLFRRMYSYALIVFTMQNLWLDILVLTL